MQLGGVGGGRAGGGGLGVAIGQDISLEVTEGMGQSPGKVALSRERYNDAWAERAEPTNTPTTRTWSWLAVCSHAGRGDSPIHKELKTEAATVTKATAVARARAMGVGGGVRGRR